MQFLALCEQGGGKDEESDEVRKRGEKSGEKWGEVGSSRKDHGLVNC